MRIRKKRKRHRARADNTSFKAKYYIFGAPHQTHAHTHTYANLHKLILSIFIHFVRFFSFSLHGTNTRFSHQKIYIQIEHSNMFQIFIVVLLLLLLLSLFLFLRVCCNRSCFAFRFSARYNVLLLLRIFLLLVSIAMPTRAKKCYSIAKVCVYAEVCVCNSMTDKG